MRKALALMTFALVFLASGLALAAEAADPGALSRVVDKLIEVAAGVLAILIPYVLWKVRAFVEKKTKIDIPEKTEAMLEAWAMKGLHYAKEIAHQKTKENITLKGPEKLELALKFGLDLAEEHKIDKKAKEKLEKYVHAKLGEAR